MALRRLPGAGAPVAGAQRDRPRPLAGRQRHHRGLDRPDPGRAVAGRGAGRRPAADPRRRGMPARARPPGSPPTAARCGTPTAPPRPPWSPAAPGSPATGRSGSACRWTAGTSPSSTRDGRHVEPGETGELIIGGVGLARYLDPAKDAEKFAAMPTLGLGSRLPQRRPGPCTTRRAASSSAGPTTRSSSAAGGSSSARSTTRCSTCPGSRRPRPRSDAPARAARCSSATSSSTTAFDHARGHGAAPRRTCRPRWSRGWRSVDDPPTRPPARSTATRCPGRSRPRRDRPAAAPSSTGTAGWVAELWRDDPRGRRRRARRRLLRPRRRQPDRRAAGVASAGAFPRGHGRRHLRAPDGRRASRRCSTRWRAPVEHEQPHGCDPTPLKTQIGQVVFTVPLRTLAGLRWLTWIAAGNNVAAGVLGVDLAADALVVVGGRRLAAARDAAGPDGADGRRAPGSCCAASGPASYPRGGKVHLRLWLAERLADELGAANLAGAAVDAALRTGSRRQGRHDVDLHSDPARHRDAHARQRLLDRARGRPDRPLARRRRAAHRRDRGRAGRQGRGPQHAVPGRVVGAGRRGRARVGGVRRRSRPASSGRVHRRERVGAARGPWARPAARTGRAGSSRTPASRPLILPAPGLAVVAALAVVLPVAAGRDVARRRGRASALAADLPARRPLVVVLALLVLARWSALLGLGLEAGHHPVHSRRGLAGLGDPARARRGADLALPALREHADAGLAPLPRAPGSAGTSRSRPR